MIKKITMGIVFFMLMSVSVYSQAVVTSEFTLGSGTMSEEEFEKSILSLHPLIIADGYRLLERLPNSVQNEIDRQLTDYRPLMNGQRFMWSGGSTANLYSGVGQLYRVILRVTDARKSDWECYAYSKSFYY